MNIFFLLQGLEGVDETSFATSAVELMQMLPDSGAEDVAADDSISRRSLFWKGLFHHLIDDEVMAILMGYDTIVMGFIRFNSLESDDRGLVILVVLNTFFDHSIAVIEAVAEDHDAGLTLNELSSLQDGVTITELLILFDEMKAGEVADVLEFISVLMFVAISELLVVPVVLGEVVSDHLLALGVDDDDVVDTGFHELFHDPLQGRAVMYGQHGLWDYLAEGEESGAETGDGNNGFHLGFTGIL